MRNRPEPRRAPRAAGQRPTAPRAGAPAVLRAPKPVAAGGTMKRTQKIPARPPAVGRYPAHSVSTGGPA